MIRVTLAALGFVAVLISTADCFAHCDTVDGPVVTAARQALETGNVNPVLIWVQKNDEAAIKEAFQKVLAVRKLNPDAQQLADTYFFETIVRVHRAGEGAPYTGLKPAGTDLGEAIPAADTAIRDGKPEPLMTLLAERVRHGTKEHFEAVKARKTFDPNDVEAGRRYVQAYVPFMHYVERVFEAAHAPAHDHGHAAAPPAH